MAEAVSLEEALTALAASKKRVTELEKELEKKAQGAQLEEG